MKNKDDNYNSRLVSEDARKYKLADNDLIELYDYINIALEFIEDNFEICGSGIGNNSIDFGIVIPIGNELPEKIGQLFFNLDNKYKINFKGNKIIHADNATEAVKKFKPLENVIEIEEVFPTEDE